MATTKPKCDIICIPKEEYERLRALDKKKTATKKKTAAKPKAATKTKKTVTKPKAVTAPKVKAIAEPKASKTPRADRTPLLETLRTRREERRALATTRNDNVLQRVDEPKALPEPEPRKLPEPDVKALPAPKDDGNTITLDESEYSVKDYEDCSQGGFLERAACRRRNRKLRKS